MSRPEKSRYVTVNFCKTCKKYVGEKHICSSKPLPPPENMPLDFLTIP